MTTSPVTHAPRAVRNSRAVVVGGGPCGVVTAFALAQAGVSSVTVLERGASDDVSGDYSFATMPRGARVLQSLPGVWDRISARASQFRAEPFVFFSQSGLRAHALKAALLAAHPDVHFTLGARCTGIEHCPDGWLHVQVDGAPALDADIVLGCDGINSQTRQALAPNPDVASGAGFELQTFHSPSTNLHFRTLYTRPSPRLVRPAGSAGDGPGLLDLHIGYLLLGNESVHPRKRLTSVRMVPVGGNADASRSVTFVLPRQPCAVGS